MRYFPESSNYAAKSDLKNTTGFDTSEFAKKIYLAHLKSDANMMKQILIKQKNVPSGKSSLESKLDKLDIGKLETTPADSINLSDVVKNSVVKNPEHDELVKKG